MAKMKAEFMNGWHKEQGTTAGDRFFGQPEKLYPFASLFAPVTNFINRQKPVKALFEKFLNIDSRRALPEFAGTTFQSWYRKNKQEIQIGGARQVLLHVDLFINYHEPEIAIAACKILNSLGYSVLVPFIRPTGRPQLSKGLLDEAAKICHENIRRYISFAERGIPIVGLEPSEILTLRDEYLDLCSEADLKKAQSIAANTFLWEEFLAAELSASDTLSIGNGEKVYIHGHCHTKALVGNDPLIQSFTLLGFDPVALETGCCGMAGSFGYEKDKFDVSMQVGEQVLFPSLRDLPEKATICAPGFSCRHQITDGVSRAAKHPAVIMAEGLTNK